MPVTPEKYAHATAAISYATIQLSLEIAFPELSPTHQRELVIDIIDRMARLAKPWSIMADEEVGE